MRKLLLLTMGMLCSVVLFGQTNFQQLTMNDAATKAKAEGKGVVALRGKMIDAPIVARAKQVLEAAEAIKGGR